MMGFGQELPEKPTLADYKTRELRVRLMLEEVMEYAEAAGVQVGVSGVSGDICGSVEDPYPISFEELVFSEQDHEPDIVAMADAVADISVTMTGTSVAHGFPLEELQEEVDSNNLLKISTGSLDEFGKFKKPENHPKPNFERVLRDAGWDGE